MALIAEVRKVKLRRAIVNPPSGCKKERVCLTLSLLGFEHPEESSGQEAELPLAGVRQRGDHLGHGRLPTHTGQTVVVCEQEPGERNMKSSLSARSVITKRKIIIITVTTIVITMSIIFIM